MKYGHWSSDSLISENTVGFVYTLYFPDLEQGYIGAKKVKTIHNKETNWRSYQSSSKAVKQLLTEGYIPEYNIEQFYNTWEEAMESEKDLQTKNNVVHSDKWLNKNIQGKTFTTQEITDETRAKMRAASKNNTPEYKAKMSKLKTGVLHTEESKKKMSAIHSGDNNEACKIKTALHPEIVQFRKDGLSYRAIGDKYNVSWSCIRDICLKYLK